MNPFGFSRIEDLSNGMRGSLLSYSLLAVVLFLSTLVNLASAESLCPEKTEIKSSSILIDIASSDENDEWLDFSVHRLLLKKELQPRSLVIKGYYGKDHKTLLCKQLLKAGFENITFHPIRTKINHIDSYHALLLSRQGVIKNLVYRSLEEERLWGYLNITLQSLDEYKLVAQNKLGVESCQEVFVTASVFKVLVPHNTNVENKEQCINYFIVPSVQDVAVEMDKQYLSNQSRLAPMEKYRCK